MGRALVSRSRRLFLGRAEEKSPKMTVLNKVEGAGSFAKFKEALDNILNLEK